jgi:cobalt-zinc-cadmium efflux system protein
VDEYDLHEHGAPGRGPADLASGEAHRHARDANHDHDHHHHRGPGHHHHAPASFGRAFAVGIALNTAYVAIEAVFGILSNSLALLADAGHNSGDVLSLGVAWMAARLARRPPSERYTYGLRGSSILAALSNAAVLLLATGAIAWAAIQKLLHPSPSAGSTMMLVAAAGVAVNGLTALLFASGGKGDVNIRSAFAHMAADAVVSLGVVIAGTLVWLTGWAWVDPAVSLVISAAIVAGTWSLMRESLDLALQAVPASVNRADVLAYLEALPGVSEVHDLHIWGMSTTENAMTAHIVRPGADLDDTLLRRVSEELRRRFDVHHATIQIEHGLDGEPCALAPLDVV